MEGAAQETWPRSASRQSGDSTWIPLGNRRLAMPQRVRTPAAAPKVRALELNSLGTSIFVGGPFSYITGSNGGWGRAQSVARVYTTTGNLHPWKIPTGTINRPTDGVGPHRNKR